MCSPGGQGAPGEAAQYAAGTPALMTAAPCRPWGSAWKAPGGQGRVRTPHSLGSMGKVRGTVSQVLPAPRHTPAPLERGHVCGVHGLGSHTRFSTARGAQPHRTGSTVFTLLSALFLHNNHRDVKSTQTRVNGMPVFASSPAWPSASALHKIPACSPGFFSVLVDV